MKAQFNQITTNVFYHVHPVVSSYGNSIVQRGFERSVPEISAASPDFTDMVADVLEVYLSQSGYLNSSTQVALVLGVWHPLLHSCFTITGSSTSYVATS